MGHWLPPKSRRLMDHDPTWRDRFESTHNGAFSRAPRRRHAVHRAQTVLVHRRYRRARHAAGPACRAARLRLREAVAPGPGWRVPRAHLHGFARSRGARVGPVQGASRTALHRARRPTDGRPTATRSGTGASARRPILHSRASNYRSSRTSASPSPAHVDGPPLRRQNHARDHAPAAVPTRLA